MCETGNKLIKVRFEPNLTLNDTTIHNFGTNNNENPRRLKHVV